MRSPACAIIGTMALLAHSVVLAQGAMPGFTPSPDAGLKARLAQANLAAGERFFERKCSQCHDAAKDGGHGKGPHLWNVFGRKAATIPSFVFSDAMKQSGVTWDYATLDYYLADTERAVPGRAMNFMGIPDDQLRADVIAFLRKFNDNPPSLPQ
jgi:cytochrome c